MTRFQLLLALVCVPGAAGAAALTSPEDASLGLLAAEVGPGSAIAIPAAPVNAQPDPGTWIAKFATYDALQGSWTFLPHGNGC